MTHLEGIKQDVQRFKAISPAQHKLKNKILAKINLIESKEAKGKKKKGRKKKRGRTKDTRPTFYYSHIPKASKIIVRGAVEKNRERKKRRREKELQKARTIKAIRESNLPESRKVYETRQITEKKKRFDLKALKNSIHRPKPLIRQEPPKTDLRIKDSADRPASPERVMQNKPVPEPKPHPFGGFKSAETEKTSEGT